MGHSHGHDLVHMRVPAHVQRLLLLSVAPFALATIIGLVALWPDGSPKVQPGGFVTTEARGTVTDVEEGECPAIPGQERFRCSTVTVRLEEGPDNGETFELEYTSAPKVRPIQVGDRVILGKAPPQPDQAEAPVPATPTQDYFFVDFDRRVPLTALAVLFAIVVVALSRWRGLAALAGVAVSLVVLARFVLPAILDGKDPLLVAIVGGATIMFIALYLAHGLNAATTTAVLGTLISLLLTGLLGLFFVDLSIFTGAGSEEAFFLQVNQQQLNLQGLLLASIIIGTLGVLDDVTVTQASAVWELHRANPDYGIGNLYRAGIRIGRDHIASTVNTLVLAYAGASLPLLIIFSISNRDLFEVLNSEIVAEEIVRTFVGSIGLVAAVPVTTGLAALVVSGVTRGNPTTTPGVTRSDPTTTPDRPDATGRDEGVEPSTSEPDPARESFRIPRHEREWRDEPR